MYRRIKQMIKPLVLTLLAALIVLIGGVMMVLWGSLPMLSGQYQLSNLNAPLSIERDARGISSIHALNREDLTRALGFLHAQDRFFQMDLMRRASAGELSELFGEKTLAFDQSRRLHRFRSRVQTVYLGLPERDRDLLEAYSAGVNEGLNALKVSPFEYFVIGTSPEPWKPEDSLLVCVNLFFALQDSTGDESLKRMLMKDLLPEDVYEFFIHNGSVWEAALDGSHQLLLPIPKKESFKYLEGKKEEDFPVILEPTLGGSNQWAITRERSHDGHAQLACDMHLTLAVPNIWYRAAFDYFEHGERYQVDGATLPGTPVMVVGSNRHVAWGFTNAHVLTCKLIPADALPFKVFYETIKVKGGEPHQMEVKETEYGPISPNLYLGQQMAFDWVAHDPDAMNIELLQLEKAKNIHDALDISKNIRVPILNLIVADSEGNIAWTLIGKIPGIDVSDYPVIVNPTENYLWTANNRTLGGEWLKRVGSESYLTGVRSYQIREALRSFNGAIPQDSLALQLQIETKFFNRWQRLLIEELELASPNEKRIQLLDVVTVWDGTCNKDSAAYYWIHEFRRLTSKSILDRILAPCVPHTHDFLFYFHDFEEPVWTIVNEQPEYLVNPAYRSWNEELLSHIDEMVAQVSVAEIKQATWGKHNTLRIHHPFGRSSSLMSFLLDPSSVPVSGDYYVPKTLYWTTGASQRMVVSPGHEEEGIFHMPGGQSGHPLSPFYRLGYEDWLQGTPSPFLPGAPIHRLELLPIPI